MTNYSSISKNILNQVKGIIGGSNVYIDKENLEAYGHDETENLNFPPEILLKPRSVEHVSKIMKLANQYNIPVTPIGARTGLSGGSLSIHGGIGISMEKFNKILEIDEDNLQVHVQPGVITQLLQEEVAKKGLYYAPDPASRGSCFIGGNIAENSGGPRAVKYGVTKDFVLNLEVVLPNGEIILIDEIHTCDSSRYWKKETYLERVNAGQEPQKLDKDACRDYVKSKCDPYKEPIPEIPDVEKDKVYDLISQIYNILGNKELSRKISDNDTRSAAIKSLKNEVTGISQKE